MKKLLYIIFFFGLLWGCKESNSNLNKQEKNAMDNSTNVTKDSVKNNDSTLVAVITTNMGVIDIELLPQYAPKTVENFVGLAKKGYYKDVIFHRVIAGFMIQGGDPTGTGRGGESIWGGTFDDEISPNLKFDTPGIVAMANAGPNTNGSQFFITVAATPWLNGHYSIFGKVIGGMDVVYTISKVPTSKPEDRPLKKVYMESVKIEKRAN